MPRRGRMSTPGRARSRHGGLDAIIITASGCGTTIKDYGFMLRLDPAYADKAARISALAKDITEYLATLDLPEPAQEPGLTVAYHSACSMQHGQKITRQPKELLRTSRLRRQGAARGASVLRLGRHLQHHAAGDRRRSCATARSGTSRRPAPTLVATGNIGCITQIASAAGMPVVHTVELLDWAYGGKRPAGI